ncbi:CNDP dipeptidase [Dichomitus squalens]|uniref:CNDP dipeptidase n=2 Tax=Dichomitus squalens TaxID=114155 RepID=A0A4Q9PZN4_9APHY|nr:CNDP dipeptidase [Dichomitus squalens LYAD-421 SS1]EJF55956.1 CNDP dipeptidase [Dichomitus squalens LYAD-421 SS1]TBU23435.1 CNDP dipeptidase [Dichomitus squalens]TBU42973.1 CNDP dipeptidase [Dichomitus squalens]TBU59804.1 CNDP dipeptidase [Dichomitus squalens]
MAAPAEFIKFIDDNANKFIARLGEAVAIPSVSGNGAHRPDVFKMSAWLDGQLKSLGVTTSLVDLGKHVMDGEELPLPPAILGRIGDDPKKKTVLVYGHYDVQPAEKSDGWDTEPFKLVVDEKTGRLIGRGSTDDKGPILGWLNVLEAHKTLGLPLPVNLRFCFEGMEENGSEGLDDLIKSETARGNDGFFGGVDCVCISDNYWLNSRTPCITYGLRGLVYFKLTVSGPTRDLHSGVFGRMVHEPMTDLVLLMSKLVAPDGTILVPGVEDLVSAADEEERAIYEKLDYSVEDVNDAVGAPITLSDDKVTVIMGRMRMPSLSLHGIEGAFYGPGAKTVIPASVSGKFSIRIVPPQTPELIEPLVIQYVEQEFAKLNSKNKLKIENLHDGRPWVADYKHWNYEAARRATQAVYRRDPDLTREGGSIPVTLTFAESLGVNVLLLPMGRGDDGAHSTNEKLDRSNFIEGSKVLGTYLYEVGAIKA